MNALLTDASLNPFPGLANPAGRPAGDAHGWRREMEKAQVTSWFHGPLQGEGEGVLRPPASSQASSGDAAQGGMAAQGRLTAGGAGDRSCSGKSERVQTDVPKIRLGVSPAARDSRPAAAPALTAGGPQSDATPDSAFDASGQEASVGDAFFPREQLLRVTRGEAPFEGAGPPRTEVRIPDDAPGPRVHVETSPDGLSVWLGIDGNEAAVAAQSAAVLAQLRRAGHAPGQRLAALVCNGHTLYSASASAQLAPTPFKELP